MQRTFAVNLALLAGLNLLVKPVYLLGVESVIQQRTGPEAFGAYFALINLSFLLNILPDMGLNNWNTRRLAADPGSSVRDVPHVLALRLWLAGGYLVVLMGLGLVIGYDARWLPMLAVLGCNQVLAAFILYFRSCLAGLHRFREDSLVSVLDRAILAAAMAWLLWGYAGGSAAFQVEWLVWGQTAAYGITLLAAAGLAARRVGGLRVETDPAFWKRALSGSLPYAGLILVSSLALRLDTVVLERLAGAAEAGYYAMGYRFFDAVNMLAYLFAVLLLPMFARQMSRRADLSALVGIAFRLMAGGLWILLLFSWMWKREIILTFYPGAPDRAVEAFGILMFSCTAFSLQYIFGTLLTAAGELRALIRYSLLGGLGGIALLALLVPRYGAAGAALSSAVVQSLICILQVVKVVKSFRPRLGKDLLRLAVFFALSALALALSAGFDRSCGSSCVPGMALFLSLSLLLAAFTRVLDFRGVISLLRRGD